MERRNALQNILNITATLSIQLAASTSSPKEQDLSQPRVALGSTPKIFPRLLATGLSKKLSSKINAIYHNRATRLQEVVVEQLGETWCNLLQKSTLDDKPLKARFRVLANALIRQLKDGRNRLVEIAIDSARNYAEETRSQPRPKWNKKFVPVFEWVFDHAFGQYPSLDERRRLAQASGLTYRQIVVWFQNRRARSKKRLAAEAAALARAENDSETEFSEDLHPSFVELLRQDPRIRPKRLIAEHLAALSPPSTTSDPEEIIDIPDIDDINDGRFLSIREEEELILQEEYLYGTRLNELDHMEAPPYSFPQQMDDSLALPAPFFPSPKWPRLALEEDPAFFPVERGEVTLLHLQLKNLSVSPPPEDEMIATLCEDYSVLDLDGANSRLDAETSASDFIPELEEDAGDSSGSEDEDSLSPIPNQDSPNSGEAQEESTEVDSTEPSIERSLRILQRGVGKVPLRRKMALRTSSMARPMAPPPRPRPKKLAVCKNIFNGRPKSIRKSRLPIIRELPPLPGYIVPQAQITNPAHAPTTPDEGLETSEDEQIEEDEYEDDGDYGEYIEEDDEDHDEDIEGVQYYCDDQELASSTLDIVQEASKDESGNLSPDESEASWSGSSYFDSDCEDPALLTGERTKLLAMPIYEQVETPQDVELPECFDIPFDPVIAESALKQTLEQMNITPNWAMPIHDLRPLGIDTFWHLLPQDAAEEVGDTDQYGIVDLVGFSNEFTDNFYAPNATVDLGLARPTAMEEYQATLPFNSGESIEYPGPESYPAELDPSLDLEAIILRGQPIDLPVCQPFTNTVADAPPPLPAVVALQETEFPEEYGDGSQYLVLDPAYDLNELEEQIYSYPSFLPPGGIPTDDRYPFIEPPPLESYRRPQPEECKIFVTHGPAQSALPLPPVVAPAPLEEPTAWLMPHLPPVPLQDVDGTEASQNVFTTGLFSLMNMITSAPRYLLGSSGDLKQPLSSLIEDIIPTAPEENQTGPWSFDEELAKDTSSIWSKFPLLDDILDFL
ncbi:hypothetical protein M408DRAFT_281141 [Serendipita vermifera MAFF 305830]|uniref:Homeobox domain-containing protein n=1 Tax=Serendipita vermifera MAFF 305830 TaxID=933852 RepID=A0A0C3ADM2_SERVB|nr:hypothetical protein M408DRAFT_281141 [Serendipita vermifera MAFF 305830]